MTSAKSLDDFVHVDVARARTRPRSLPATDPVQQARLISLAPQSAGPMLSLNSSMLYLGNAAGAALGGVVVSQFSVISTGWFGGVIALIGLGALGWSFIVQNRPALVISPANEKLVNE